MNEERKPLLKKTKPRVLFLCTGNSCRSQMAEGLLRGLRPDFEVYSAGTCPDRVHPWAIAAMGEIGIDISGHTSKSVADLPVKTFDTVITVCDNARQTCPIFPGTKRQIHWSIPDPAAAGGTRSDIERTFRSARDTLRQRIESEFRQPG